MTEEQKRMYDELVKAGAIPDTIKQEPQGVVLGKITPEKKTPMEILQQYGKSVADFKSALQLNGFNEVEITILEKIVFHNVNPMMAVMQSGLGQAQIQQSLEKVKAFLRSQNIQI